MPWVMPPCTWPSTIIGLIILPKSSTAVKRRSASRRCRGRPPPRRRRCPREGEVGRVVERVLVQPGLELVVRVVVRHVGGERHLAERLLAVGARDLELAAVVLDVGFRRLQQVRRDLPALGDDLVERLDDGGAAHGDRARAVGAHAEQDLRGIAVHDRHVVDRQAEPVGDHLRERGLVPLAVRMRAGEHGDRAGRMHADLARLEQAGARAERAGDVGRRDAARFDVGGIADAAQLAVSSDRWLCAPC